MTPTPSVHRFGLRSASTPAASGRCPPAFGVVLVLVLLAAATLAQAGGDADKLCGTCKTSGVVDVEVGSKWKA